MMTHEKGLHPRNIHRQGYDFQALLKESPNLSSYIKASPYDGNPTIDYANPNAVLALNQALLSFHYKIKNWSIPKGNLCPPVPGRADYLHYIADILAQNNSEKPLVGTNIKGLDIGTGTSCIYPLLGNSIYGWKFVGTDINPDAINNVKNILNANPTFKKNIKTRFQKNSDHIFKDLLQADEKFDFTMCNPQSLRSTLRLWNYEILNYFSTKLTNGRTEGYNRKAKLIQRCAYGFRSFKNYRLKLLYSCR